MSKNYENWSVCIGFLFTSQFYCERPCTLCHDGKILKFSVYISATIWQQPGADGANLHVYFFRSNGAYLATQASQVCFFHGWTNVSKGSGSKWVSDGRKLSILLYIPQASTWGLLSSNVAFLIKFWYQMPWSRSMVYISESEWIFAVKKLKCSVCSEYRSIIR